MKRGLLTSVRTDRPRRTARAYSVLVVIVLAVASACEVPQRPQRPLADQPHVFTIGSEKVCGHYMEVWRNGCIVVKRKIYAASSPYEDWTAGAACAAGRESTQAVIDTGHVCPGVAAESGK